MSKFMLRAWFRNHGLELILALGLGLLPFWLYQNHYYLGGDDTRLYYLFPGQFLSNYVFNLSSNNTLAGAMTGYNSVAYYAPFYGLVWLVSQLRVVNPQLLLYGLNLSLGFVFFELLLGLMFKANSRLDYYLRLLGGVAYIGSIYLIYFSYQNQLLAMYLVSVLPATVYFGLRGLEDGRIRDLLLAALIFSVGSGTLATLPWWSAFLISSSPLLGLVLIKYRRRWRAGLIFGVVMLLLNGYWLISFGDQLIFHASGSLASYSSADFVNDNLRIVKGVATSYAPLNVLFSVVDRQVNLSSFSSWWVINVIWWGVIIYAGLKLRHAESRLVAWYLASLACLLLSWWLFSPNFSEGSVNLFVKLATKVPFFTMFRNMYDKFALSMAFYLALSLGLSLRILLSGHQLSRRVGLGLGVVLAVIVINAGWGYCQNQLNHPVQYRLSGKFNPDFTALISYLNQQPDQAAVMWLPQNSPTYVNIEDGEFPGQWYSGLSPLRVLTNRNDYSGRYSWITQADLFAGEKLMAQIAAGRYQSAAEVISSRGIKYVVIDHQRLPGEIDQFMYGANQQLRQIQTAAFDQSLLGPKVRDFGRRYSLYVIKPELEQGRLSVVSSLGQVRLINYQQIDNEHYQFEVEVKPGDRLAFLMPYDSRWQLYSQQQLVGKPMVWEGYANQWLLTSVTGQQQFDLVFGPARYYRLAQLISLIAGVLVLGSVIFSYVRKPIR